MEKVRVRASKRYDVTITRGGTAFAGAVKGKIKGNKVAVFTDQTVETLYGDYFDGALSGALAYKKILPTGEDAKTTQTYLSALSFLAQNGFTREDTVICFGGGAVGDLAGFVASTYMRGVTLISVPTTLLSAIDSSVGGKTAVNLPEGKNLCGSFYQPDAVYIDLDLFNTLPPREWESGKGEFLKYAFLSGRYNEEIDERAVKRCLSYKAKIVKKDETENGARRLLNLGHTVGHAVEYLSGYALSHGACVAKGIAAAIAVSKKLYGLDEKCVQKMYSLCARLGHDISLPYAAKDLVKAMNLDKKRTGEGVRFVTLRGVGKPKVELLPLSFIEEALS